MLQLLSLVHVIIGHEVYMHWVHRILLIVSMLAAVGVLVALTNVYNHGWQLQHMSLMVSTEYR